MNDHELPRVLRRAVGLMRFARDTLGSSAASMFLLDESGTSLRGVVSEWDWTRTSFPTDVTEWPSVERALASGLPTVISAIDAGGAEHGWFEARGITRTVCVPLRCGTIGLGVLFFDFDALFELGDGTQPLSPRDAAMLVDVAQRCVRAFTRERNATPPTSMDARWVH